MAARMLSRLPSGVSVTREETARAYRETMAAHQGRPGAEQFAKVFAQCEGQRSWTAYGRNVRECVEFWHDTYMTEVNVQVWQTIGAGS
jgi:hypothetical protein